MGGRDKKRKQKPERRKEKRNMRKIMSWEPREF